MKQKWRFTIRWGGGGILNLNKKLINIDMKSYNIIVVAVQTFIIFFPHVLVFAF